MSDGIENLRIVVVGGVAGGGSAAARARRCNASAEIVVLEKGSAVSYANCGLPYHLGGEISDRSKLLVATPELFWDRFRIRVRTGHEVTDINRKAEVVTGRTTHGEEFKVPYDRLILATGSAPLEPSFLTEVHAENVFHLWTLDDMDRILAYMKKRPCKKAIVVGAGYVGLEVIEQLVQLGTKVTLIERLPQVLATLDRELARLIEQELRSQGVAVELSAEVDHLLTSSHRVTAVKVGDSSIAADLVIVASGVRPRIELAQQTGLEIGGAGGVVVNEVCQTSDPKIYACGDMIEYHHGVLDRPSRMPLAGPANRSGRVAGAHAACGKAEPLGPVQGTAVVRIFGLTAGSTGLNERGCQQAGLAFRVATIQAPHHASYFPGARGLIVKILYSPHDRRLLGGAVVGAGGVDKRLDVLASVLHFQGTIDDLAGLDLAYAPPYGSAKDPVHMAAFVAQNDLAGAPPLIPFDAPLEDYQVVDVRTAAEIAKLPLEGAIAIPIDELSERWTELDATQPTLTVCHSGKRAHIAACWLKGKGFTSVANLNGGVSIRLRQH